MKWILITSVFVFFCIGVGAGIGLSFEFDQNTTDIVIPEIHDVIGAKAGDCVMDTEQGSIDIVCSNLPEVLPLCITNEKLENYYVKVAVTGGYIPTSSIIKLSQDKGDDNYICVDWEHVCHEPCYTDYWVATFSLPCGVDSIELLSNQWPEGATPFVDNPTIPGKEVNINWCSIWKGCDNNDQKFWYIQIQKSDFFRVPNSE